MNGVRGPSLRLLRNEGARSLLAPLTKGRASAHIRPTIAAVYLTGYCNSRCTMCDFWKKERDPTELNSEDWGVIFSRLKAFGVEFVGVNASGEMFTRRDVFDILGHLRDLGLAFGVNTNATLLTRDKARRLAGLGPRQVTVGLDGVGEDAYLATRGLKGGFAKVARHMEYLRQAGIANLSIGSVLMRESLDQWVPLARFALEAGLAGVRFTAFHQGYFNVEDKTEGYSAPAFLAAVEAEIDKLITLKRQTGIVKNSEDYLRRVVAYYRDPHGYFPAPCLQGSNRIEVDVHGNVTLCSFVTESLGNLLHQEMEEIWDSAAHRSAREAAYRGECPRCFLSCYGEENLRLSAGGVFPTLGESLRRATRLLGPRR